ncbi:MAG: Gfo/Idh/MocA family oxidoreductase [Myxococcota bacterium]
MHSNSRVGASLRFGILGCADIAWRRMLPALAAHPSTTVTAHASRSTDKARKFAERFGGTPCTGYQALLERSDVDAVYIPLPNSHHYEWAARALRASKHVLCEKPLTTDARQTEELLELSERHGVSLMENYAFEFHSMHARARELVDQGAVGELRHFSSAFTVPRRPEGDIRLRHDLGGGAMLDAAGYPLRAALHLLGPIEILDVVPQQSGEIDVAGTVLARTPSNVSVTLTYGLDHFYRADYVFHGSTGRLSLDRVFTAPADFEPTLRLSTRNGHQELTLAADDQVRHMLTAFVASASAARDAQRRATTSLHARLLDDIRAQRALREIEQ